MTSAAATARRWIALAAAVAIALHAFGMGLLGPRMAETAALRLAAELAEAPAFVLAEHCGSAAAAEDAHAGHAGHGEPDGAPGHKHPPSCEACPLGQAGMALAPPPVVPAATALARIERRATSARLLRLAAWPYRTPPARGPPPAAA